MTTKRCISGIIGILIVLAVIGIIILYAGLYNVSARYPDPHPLAWLADTAMTHSVQHHAAGIKVPALDNPQMVKAGVGRYNDTCVGCHGAPGIEIGDIGKGLRPDPPELKESAGDWKSNELFWITQNGVRMTGMPAWGVTQKDKQIWEIVAFLKRMPTMSTEEYNKLSKEAAKQ